MKMSLSMRSTSSSRSEQAFARLLDLIFLRVEFGLIRYTHQLIEADGGAFFHLDRLASTDEYNETGWADLNVRMPASLEAAMFTPMDIIEAVEKLVEEYDKQLDHLHELSLLKTGPYRALYLDEDAPVLSKAFLNLSSAERKKLARTFWNNAAFSLNAINGPGRVEYALDPHSYSGKREHIYATAYFQQRLTEEGMYPSYSARVPARLNLIDNVVQASQELRYWGIYDF
jgi:hypothetical protein